MSATDDNVHIENSYKIVTPWIRYGYSFYLNHINSDTKNVIKGSSLGVSFEWESHNLAALFGFGGEAAENLDVGATIFSDLKIHPLRDENGKLSKTGIASVGMVTMYVLYRTSLILRFGI